MALPTISIVIPTYNAERYLGQCLWSIARQRYSRTEIVIIDGNSTDNTAAVVARYGSLVTHFISQADSGQAEAVTKGLGLVTGDIAHWQAADDIILPGAFDRVVKTFAEEPQVDLLFSDNIAFDGDRVYAGDHVRWVSFWTALLFFGRFQSECAYWRHRITPSGLPLDCSKPLTCDEDFFIRLWSGHTQRWISQPLGAFRIRPGQLSQILPKEVVSDDRRKSRESVLRRLDLSRNEMTMLRCRYWLPYLLGTQIMPKIISAARYASRCATFDSGRRKYSAWFYNWIVEPPSPCDHR
jgi:glycosyltransferase involved in cell wall biosynthesis